MSRGDSVYPFQVRMSQVNDQGVACYDAFSKEVQMCLQSLTMHEINLIQEIVDICALYFPNGGDFNPMEKHSSLAKCSE